MDEYSGVKMQKRRGLPLCEIMKSKILTKPGCALDEKSIKFTIIKYC